MRAAGTLACVLLALASLGCSRQEAAWQSAQAADTAAAYERYLQDYPGGTHAGQARSRLLEARGRDAWQRALRLDSPEAYQRYLAEFPDGRHAAEARGRLAGFVRAGAQTDGGPPAPAAGAGALRQQATGPGHRLQLGAFGTETAAREAWSRLRAQHADLLGGLAAQVDAIDGGDRLLWRLQLGPMSEAQASRLCADLNLSRSDCLVVRE